MLLRERMEQYPFSNNERIVIDFILKQEEKIKDYSTKMIADETYTSPSILIRIAKKLGFNGWNELKKTYLEEVSYLNSHFESINANFPFSKNDSIMTIAAKIIQLQQESLHDTHTLLQHDSLQKAVQLLKKATRIKVFAISNLLFAAEEFQYKMRRINYEVLTFPTQNLQEYEAARSTKDECAILISYSGETPDILYYAKNLKKKNTPMIAITSIGVNSLSSFADVTLHVTTREKSYSKIAAFSSVESITAILNILYACVFALDYDKTLQLKIQLSQSLEKRTIDNKIISEKNES